MSGVAHPELSQSMQLLFACDVSLTRVICSKSERRLAVTFSRRRRPEDAERCEAAERREAAGKQELCQIKWIGSANSALIVELARIPFAMDCLVSFRICSTRLQRARPFVQNRHGVYLTSGHPTGTVDGSGVDYLSRRFLAEEPETVASLNRVVWIMPMSPGLTAGDSQCHVMAPGMIAIADGPSK